MSLEDLEPGVARRGPPAMTGGYRAWAFDIDLEDAALARLLSLLSADEIARADRLRDHRDRARYVAGRGRLRQILGHCLGQAPASLLFTYSTFGKPALATDTGEPLLQFNASGSDGLALVAAHPSAALGIDIERVRVLTDLSALARMLLSQAEHAEFGSLPAAQQADRLLEYWTRKEALAKAIGTGLRQGLDRLSLHPWPGHRAHEVECATGTLWVAPLALPREGHVAALASAVPVGEVLCEWWDSQPAH